MSASAGEITIHGASWGRAAAAPAPVAAVRHSQRPSLSDAGFQPQRPRYGNNINYGDKIRYAGAFHMDVTKRQRRSYRISNNIRYAGKFRNKRSFRRPARVSRPSNRPRYGNRIRYGHGQGYGISGRR